MQSFKFDNPHVQVEVFKLTGLAAKKRGGQRDWHRLQRLYNARGPTRKQERHRGPGSGPTEAKRGPWSRGAVPAVLGLDIGGVLVDRVAEREDTSSFGSRPMETPSVASALEAVAELVALFEGRVHVVSKGGPRIASLSRA